MVEDAEARELVRRHKPFDPLLTLAQTEDLARRLYPEQKLHASYWPDPLEAMLINALAEKWEERTGKSARTRGTGASELAEGKFPFGDWVAKLFEEEGKTAPSLYAIRKAIKRVPKVLTLRP